MQKQSFTISSLAVLAVSSALRWADIEVAPEAVQGFVLTSAQLIAAAGIWYGRYRQGDITWYGRKK